MIAASLVAAPYFSMSALIFLSSSVVTIAAPPYALLAAMKTAGEGSYTINQNNLTVKDNSLLLT